MTRLLDPAGLAEKLGPPIAARAAQLVGIGRRPKLVAVFSTDEAGTSLYLRRLDTIGRVVGVSVEPRESPDAASLGALVDRANQDPATHGVILMKPLPPGIAIAVLAERIDPSKDVEGLGPANAGLLMLGRPRYVPSTAEAIVLLLQESRIPLRSSHVVIVGRSETVGRPVALLLLAENASVTITHRATPGLARLTSQADIVVLCAGVPRLLRGDMIRPGAVVVDAGITSTLSGVVGDADFGSVSAVAAAMTPPGTLGPLTATLLLRNVVHAAESLF